MKLVTTIFFLFTTVCLATSQDLTINSFKGFDTTYGRNKTHNQLTDLLIQELNSNGVNVKKNGNNTVVSDPWNYEIDAGSIDIRNTTNSVCVNFHVPNITTPFKTYCKEVKTESTRELQKLLREIISDIITDYSFSQEDYNWKKQQLVSNDTQSEIIKKIALNPDMNLLEGIWTVDKMSFLFLKDSQPEEIYTIYRLNTDPSGSNRVMTSFGKLNFTNPLKPYIFDPLNRIDFSLVAFSENGFIYNMQYSGNKIVFNFIKDLPINWSSFSNKKDEALSSEWLGNGTGFFISNTGLIATNYHVIEDANEIEVVVNYKSRVIKFAGKVILSDKVNDLSIIKVDGFNKDLPYVLDFSLSKVGENVFTLGYPKALNLLGKEVKYTNGVISSKTGVNGDISTYQTNVAVQPGNSGGPLFNNKGDVIGIISAKIIRDDVENVSYAVKSSYLRNLIDLVSIKIGSKRTLNVDMSRSEMIDVIDDFVVLIKVN